MNNMPFNATTAQKFVPQPFSTSRLKKRAKQCLSGKFGSVLGMLLLLVIVYNALNFAVGWTHAAILRHYWLSDSATYTSLRVAQLILNSVSLIFTLLIAGPLRIGHIAIPMAAVEERKPSFSDAFFGFQHFGRCCGASLLQFLFIILWSLLIVIPFGVIGSLVNGSPIFLFVFFVAYMALIMVKGLSYSATFYLIRKYPHLGANQAITESRRIMDGHKGEAFILWLSFIGWLLLPCIAAGLLYYFICPNLDVVISVGAGLLFAPIEPYLGTTFACFYDELIEADAARNPAKVAASAGTCPPPIS